MRSRILLLVILISLCSAGYSQTRLEGEARARSEVFDRVWNAVNERYYDRNFRGVDWPAQRERYRSKAVNTTSRPEFYAVVRQMLATLGDAHMRIFSPEENFDRNRPAGISVGVIARRVEGEPIVVWVEPGSEAARNGLRPGDVIKSVDREPVENVLKKIQLDAGRSSTPVALELMSFDRLFYGPRESTVNLAFKNDSGNERTATLKRRFVDFPRRVVTRILPNDIGYIELTGFAPQIENDFTHALTTLRNSRGLIIDLRQNGGGFVSSVTRLAGHFFPRETELGVFTTRKGQATRRQTSRSKIVYNEPVVILLSSRSASGAEMFAAAMQEQERALLVGNHATTCGCLVGVSRTLTLPDGGRLNVSDSDFRTARGQRIEGKGVRPKEVLELKIADVAAGRDRALEWAVAFLDRPKEGTQ